MARALIIEDHTETAQLIADHLLRAGHEVELLDSGQHALAHVVQMRPQLLVLDWMLPHVTGPDICRAVRRLPGAQPIVVMLTARGDELDVLEGFAAGIDDYVRKPFGVRELLCRFEALLRLAQRDARRGGVVQLGALRVDSVQRTAHVGENKLDLTPKELDLLLHLVQQPRTVHSREALLQQVWGYSHAGYARTVDSHVTRLRRKLAQAGLERELIVTVHRLGYRLEPGEAP